MVETAAGMIGQVMASVIRDAGAHAAHFLTAKPFRHVVIENFFAAEFADSLLRDFPTFDPERARNEFGEVGRKAVHENIASISDTYARLYGLLESEDFLRVMSDLTGIPGLRNDPRMFGGGTHENLHGQELDPHIDFNYDPPTKLHRRINLLVYLNKEWRPEWGGQIELHSNPRRPPENRITAFEPLFNRALIFETNEISWHGFPRINLPEDRRGLTRKSLSIYLYTTDRPEHEKVPEHSTFYVQRWFSPHIREGHVLTREDMDQINGLLTGRDRWIKHYQQQEIRLSADMGRLANRAGTGATVPRRYSANLERYAARGGLIQPDEDSRGFLAAGADEADMARFYFLCLIFDLIVKEDLAGGFAELGSPLGRTAGLLAHMARKLGKTLATFSGPGEAVPLATGARAGTGSAENSAEFVRFAPDDYSGAAARMPPEASYCLVHLDCTLYAPMARAIAHFYPRLAPGGFLVMHNYASLQSDGAERAVDEFLAGKPESLVPMPDSGGSAVIRKAAIPARFDNWYVRRNAALFGPEWTTAEHGNLSGTLGDGWSAPEPWGVWGIDGTHGIFVLAASPPAGDIELEFDVHAFLLGNPARRDVDIKANGRSLGCWVFTADTNRQVQRLRIPRTWFPVGDEPPAILVEFQQTVAAEVSVSDTRRLGIALHRVRRIA